MLEELKATMQTEENQITQDLLSGRKIAERLPNHTFKILEVLQKDDNKELMTTFHNYTNEDSGSKICLEDIGKHIDAHLYDDDRDLVTTISITDDQKDPLLQIVGKETFKDLKKLTVDYDKARSDVELSMRNSL